MKVSSSLLKSSILFSIPHADEVLIFWGGSHHNYVMNMQTECTHNAESMFDVITISITNINLKCTKVFPLLIIYHNKFLSYFNKITLISYAFVYMKDQTIVKLFFHHCGLQICQNF